MGAFRLVWRYGVETVVVILMAVMVATLALQVFYRFVVQDPLSWTEELARYAFVWVTFLGAAVAYRHGSHVAIETIVLLLPHRAQVALAWVVDALMVVALAVLLVQGLGIVEATANVRATMLQVPMSWIYASVPVSAVIMLAFQVERTLRRMRGTLPPVVLPGEEAV